MKKLIGLLIIQILILSSCPSPIKSEISESPDPGNPPILEKENLFLSKDSGRLFSTNIFEFGAGTGATYWMEEVEPTSVFLGFEIDMKKISGHSLGGYGVFFSQKNGGLDSFSALTVLINIAGEYCVGLIDQGSFSYLKEWTDCISLNRGYSQNNRISITSPSPGFFRISLNGVHVLEFKDSSNPVHEGGGSGYLAVVSPLENFPSIPVSIEFYPVP